MVEYTEPGVAWDDATKVMPVDGAGTLMLDTSLRRMTPGSIMVSGDFACRIGTRTDSDDDNMERVQRIGMPSALTDYHHGPPTAAPTGLMAHDAGPDARRLVWDEMDALTYELRSTADATDDDAWTDWEDGHERRRGRRVENGHGVHV